MTKLTQKSQVTIPLEIRKKIGLDPGDEVEFRVRRMTVVIQKKKKIGVVDKYKGLLGKGKTEEVMAELR